MCGRFVSASTPEDIANYFAADVFATSSDASGETGGTPDSSGPAPAAGPVGSVSANYNVAPTTDVWTVYADDGLRRVDGFRWGLVPSWAKTLAVGNKMINARSETVAEKSAFKRSFERRRCIVPADGFYEWKSVPGQKTKQPYFISRPDGEPYALGGLWAQWRGEVGGEAVTVRSTTILTTTANDAMSAVHDRMPVILAPGDWDEWLDPDQRDLSALGRLLVPAPSNLITLRPVSTEVNNVRNNGPQLLDEVDPTAAGELFSR